MGVAMVGRVMRAGFAAMAMRVQMHDAVAMPVQMKMNPVAHQAIEHMRAEPDQHQADGEFQNRREAAADRYAKPDRAAGEQKNRTSSLSDFGVIFV